ncbi:hypothetical protein GCM10009687_20760 [Asanoa iriomotensis]
MPAGTHGAAAHIRRLDWGSGGTTQSIVPDLGAGAAHLGAGRVVQRSRGMTLANVAMWGCSTVM